MINIRVGNERELLREVQRLSDESARLITITGVDLGEEIEVIYHFDLEQIVNLRIILEYDQMLPTISEIFFPARLYERELCEMFGVKIRGVEGGILLSKDMLGKAPLRKRYKVEEVIIEKSAEKKEEG